MKKNYKIALIISIIAILLIILAFIMFNTKKIFLGKQELDTKKITENDARQNIEYILENAKSAKENDSNYNSEDYLTALFKKNNFTISGNIVSYGGYNFQINREDLSISENLGSTNVTITDSISNILDESSATCLVRVNSNIDIDSIIFENTDGTLTTEKVNDRSFEKEINILLNKTYTVSIVTSDGKISKKNIRQVSAEYGEVYGLLSKTSPVDISSKFPHDYENFTVNKNFVYGIEGSTGSFSTTVNTTFNKWAYSSENSNIHIPTYNSGIYTPGYGNIRGKVRQFNICISSQ